MNDLMPACTISPMNDRSSAGSSVTHGMSVSIRFSAAVDSAPLERVSRWAICARVRVTGPVWQ